MKKITFLLILFTIVFANAQTPEGTWKMNPDAGAFGVGPNQADTSWYANTTADITTRACFFDDEFIFNTDGSFNNVNGVDTWTEGWQGGTDSCAASVAPHDGSNAATWAYDATANTITLTGVGAYLGLPKVVNGSELSDPANAPASITYTVTSITSLLMTLDIDFGGGWWRFVMQKQGVAATCDDGVMNGDETGVDCGGSCTNVCLAQIDLPLTFDGSTTDFTLTDFGGNISSLVTDPTNVNNMVMQITKPLGADSWAGTTLGNENINGAALATAIPVTVANSKMFVNIWSPDANTPIRLKIEDSTDPTHSVETETNTTVAGAWEILEFDFNNEATGTAILNPAFTFDKASLFFNFNTTGDNARLAEKIYYFDNVSFNMALSTEEFVANEFAVFPNPTNNNWNVKATQNVKTVQVFDVLGKLVITLEPNATDFTINSESISTGLYFARMNSNTGIITIKLVKE